MNSPQLAVVLLTSPTRPSRKRLSLPPPRGGSTESSYGRPRPDQPSRRGSGLSWAAGKGDYETAAGYLNTRLRGPAAEGLARQLSIVLDRRLVMHLSELSDQAPSKAATAA
jgi:hypothetical protein